MPIERHTTLEILRRLATTQIGERLILGGSSGFHAASDKIPPLTEDVDLLIDADWVAGHEPVLLSEMEKAGFKHHPGTCTLSLDDGSSIDLVGYSKADRDDRIGGGDKVPVMVFADLSIILAHVEPVNVPTGGLTLPPAALAVVKLLTIRQEKGSKDKLQALLLFDERSGDEDFLAEVRGLLDHFERDRVDDALADAQAALMSISTDLDAAEPQAKGYAEMRTATARGFKVLEQLIGAEDDAA